MGLRNLTQDTIPQSTILISTILQDTIPQSTILQDTIPQSTIRAAFKLKRENNWFRDKSPRLRHNFFYFTNMHRTTRTCDLWFCKREYF